MKKVIFILAMILMAGIVNAQPLQPGTNILNLGIGFGSNLGGLGTGRPAISASFDHGKWEIGGPGIISIGGYIGNSGYSYKSEGDSQKWNYTVIGARSAYHYNGFENLANLDAYGGLMLSYNIVSYKADNYDGPNNFGGGLGLSAYIGGRYFFNNKLGAFAELGYGVSTLNAGLTYKL